MVKKTKQNDKKEENKKKKVIIMGAAGRDFHDFNTCFRENEEYEVVGFTATQIPYIENREYPSDLSGELYPNGIKIYDEEELPKLIEEENIDQVILSYSDLSHEYVMHKASIALSNGADFRLMGPEHYQIESDKPIISVGAVRTGCGKSQTTRKIATILDNKGYNVVVIRHPMPYGDLSKQKIQRYSEYKDLDKYECTIEEREEYEPYIDKEITLYSGVDYELILEEAEKEADVILWDGGNNEPPFYKPDLHVVVTDPHRPESETKYHPGEANLRMADIAIINKEATAEPKGIEKVRKNIQELNPEANIIDAASPLLVEEPSKIKGKKALVVEDGPTLTHGDMKYGAGTIAARKYGSKEIINPKPYAIGTIKQTYEKFPQIGKVLPAMGYSKKQIKELEQTINKSEAEIVVSGTPINLEKIINVQKPIIRVKYELDEIGEPDLNQIIEKFEKKQLK